MNNNVDSIQKYQFFNKSDENDLKEPLLNPEQQENKNDNDKQASPVLPNEKQQRFMMHAESKHSLRFDSLSVEEYIAKHPEL